MPETTAPAAAVDHLLAEIPAVTNRRHRTSSKFIGDPTSHRDLLTAPLPASVGRPMCEQAHMIQHAIDCAKSTLFNCAPDALGNLGPRRYAGAQGGFARVGRRIGGGVAGLLIAEGWRSLTTARRHVTTGLDSEYPGIAWGSKEGKCLR